jgi:hypothetical protein
MCQQLGLPCNPELCPAGMLPQECGDDLKLCDGTTEVVQPPADPNQLEMVFPQQPGCFTPFDTGRRSIVVGDRSL